ncbi:MAG: hypothetical protein M3Z03_14045 [Actinomycetota bacterium]|nr:hypothetical protein [Actinomycetota bacterium]
MGLVSPKGEDDGEDDLQIQLSGELWLDGLENLDGREDEVRFDLADWPEATRERLRERLDLFLVVSHWADDTTLVVTEPLDPVYLERVLTQVKEQAGQELDPTPAGQVDAPAGGGPVEEIGYDLDGWDEVNRSVLFAALEAEGIAFRIALPVDDPEGAEELIVAEADEVRVDEIIDGIVEPDGDDGPAARPELLGELFVAADRLVRDPTDPGGHRALQEGVEAAADGAPPFGVEKAWWQAVVRQAGELVDRLGAHGVEHDEIVEQATSLRDLLRPYV